VSSTPRSQNCPHDPRNASKQILAQIALKLIGDRSAGDKKENKSNSQLKLLNLQHWWRNEKRKPVAFAGHGL